MISSDIEEMIRESEANYRDQLNEEYCNEHKDEEDYGASVEDMTEAERIQEEEEWEKEHPWDEEADV